MYWSALLNGGAGAALRHYGAGDGNRTHVSSLGSCSSTIELHPLNHAAQIRGVGIRGYLASWNSVDGTQPSLPSSSLTFHHMPCFSPDGYSIMPGSRSRTTAAFWSGFSYIRPGLAMVTDCETLSALASGLICLTSSTSFVNACRYAIVTTWPISVLA